MTKPPPLIDVGALAASDRGRVGLLSARFVVEVANVSRDGGDLLEPLVFAAIVQANQAVLRNDAWAQRLYGDTGEALPDELRRPISINAVAHSLRLPFETVRRKVRRLQEAGQCVVTPKGAYVPRAVIMGERHAAIQRARLAQLAVLHDELVTARFLDRDQALSRPTPETMMRAANRALSEYMLRSCDRMVELVRSVADGFILLGLGAANAEHQLAGRAEAPPVSRPCPTRALAARLGLPPETARRRLMGLAQAGFARRDAAGWIVQLPAAEAERALRLAADNETDLKRLFVRLKELAG